MSIESQTDTFFFTKNNNKQSNTARSLPHIALPTSRSNQLRRDSIQELFDNYHLFKCFFP